MQKQGFTLAEILITLTIIGIVAALTIPSVMTNVQQRQFETGYRKAINVLNDAIQTNLANDGTTPYALTNANMKLDIDGDGRVTIMDATLYQKMTAGAVGTSIMPPLAEFLMKPLNVVKTAIVKNDDANPEVGNFAFYTTDGMRFEVPYPNGEEIDLPLYESDMRITNGSCTAQKYGVDFCKNESIATSCGSLGLLQNPNKTTTSPCLIIVDVNGDKKPNPDQMIKYGNSGYGNNNYHHSEYTVPKPEDGLYMDVFPVMITDRAAVPYGAVAQRTLYEREDAEVQKTGN